MRLIGSMEDILTQKVHSLRNKRSRLGGVIINTVLTERPSDGKIISAVIMNPRTEYKTDRDQ